MYGDVCSLTFFRITVTESGMPECQQISETLGMTAGWKVCVPEPVCDLAMMARMYIWALNAAGTLGGSNLPAPPEFSFNAAPISGFAESV
jgi:hypothetical protein